MDKPLLLEKINSKYIFQNIFSYIRFENIKIHLFKYSKLFQKKVGLSLVDYKVNYLKNLDLHLYNYLDNTDDFDKDYKNKKLKDDMIKYKFNMNDLIAYSDDLYQEYIKKNEIPDPDDLIDTIDIYSPLFDAFSLKEYFEKFFSLKIPINLIKNYNLLNDYILAFDKLNKLNSNYPTLELQIKDGNDMEYLKRLNLNFNKLKKLKVNIDKDNGFISSYNCLFENLFTLPDIQHSLVSLEIEGGKPQKDYNINSYSDEDDENEEEEDEEILKIFENLNKFESLEKLIMRDFIFEKTFTLKLNNLKELYLFECLDIAFAENSCLNLKVLFLYSNSINMPKKSLKLPELENFEYERGNIIKYNESNENEGEDENGDNENDNLFDFESLKKLKFLNITISDFSNYINSPLESVEICDTSHSKEEEKKMIENILSIKTLKIAKILLDKINADEIKEIKGESKSVEELKLIFDINHNDYDFYNLQKKFPNLLFLEFNSRKSYAKNFILEIIEDTSFKVDKLSKNRFYIGSFGSLKLISLNILSQGIKNLEETFPFFNNNCKVVLKSLTDFKFYYYADSPDNKKKNLRAFYNLNNNLDLMPNLKIFYLYCNIEDVDELDYKAFIKKLLSMKLDEIRLNIQVNINNEDPTGSTYYTRKELKQINPNINYYELNNDISICKLRKSQS